MCDLNLAKLLFALYFVLMCRPMCVFVGKVIHSMVAHLDAVTSLAIDPSGLYLLSGSEYYGPFKTYYFMLFTYFQVV